ncbi:MAG: hypothetical protein HY075_09595 [Deltaproteobacteria bacterium]|nr:hypothetical protein [Deltaproteobacteria bacterium]
MTARNVHLYDGALSNAFTAVPVGAALPVSFVSSDELVVKHAGLAQAYEGLRAPVAVDMETAALAAVAATRSIPIAVFRLISDTPERPMPGFMNDVARAIVDTDLRARLTSGARGIKGALREPVAAARFARDLSRWSKLLAQGWAERADSIYSATV